MTVNDAPRTPGGWAARILPAVGLAVVVGTALAGAAGQAEHKPLWHDEVYTLYVATAGSLSAVLATFTIPIDFNPPGYL